MASGQIGSVLRHVQRLFQGGTVAGMTEGQLLENYRARRDEAAFEALVARYGPMVLGVCRQLLADPHDVEDAFQATFLVLVRKASSIRDGDRLGPWLYGVAYRVASRARVGTRISRWETPPRARRSCRRSRASWQAAHRAWQASPFDVDTSAVGRAFRS